MKTPRAPKNALIGSHESEIYDPPVKKTTKKKKPSKSQSLGSAIGAATKAATTSPKAGAAAPAPTRAHAGASSYAVATNPPPANTAVASTPTAPATTTPAMDQASIDAQIQQQYGYMSWALHDPELYQVFSNAIANHQGPNELRAALEATNWWKTHSDTARQFIQKESEDPASAQQDITNQGATIAAQAAQLGIQIDPQRLAQMARDSLTMGWNSDEMRQAIANEFHYNPNLASTQNNVTVQGLKQEAAKYLVPLSDQTLAQWTSQMLGGTATKDMFDVYLGQQAKSLYPQMSQAIDSGVTPTQFVDPYRQLAAQELQIAPDSVNFMDPKWSKAIHQIDPKTNTPTMMNLSDWQTELRSNAVYGWDHTQNGRAAAADLSTQLMQHMGAA